VNADLLLPAALLAGFLGSGHCFGMCGPVVLLLEGPGRDVGSPWRRRLLYNLGRLAFYALLGAVAGAAGLVLTKIAGAQLALRALRLLAAMLVMAIGLNLLFELRLLAIVEKGGAAIWRRLSPLASHVLPATTAARALAAGFIWGALPCGLVYSVVAMAATSGELAAGAAVMTAFWLGTLPALLLAGTAAGRIGRLGGSRPLRRASGMLLIAIGGLALVMPYIGESRGHRHEAVARTLPPAGSSLR